MAQLMKPDPLSPQKPYLFSFAKYAKLKQHHNSAGFPSMVSQNTSNIPIFSQFENHITESSKSSQTILGNITNNANLSQASLSQRKSSNLSNNSNFLISTQGSSGATSQRTVSSYHSKAQQIQEDVKIPLLNLQPFSLSSFIQNQTNYSQKIDPSQSQPTMRRIKGIAKSTEKLPLNSSMQFYQNSSVFDVKNICINQTTKQDQDVHNPSLSNSLVLVQIPHEIEILSKVLPQQNQEQPQLHKSESKCSPAELQECQYLHDLIANITSPQLNTNQTAGIEEYQYFPSSIKKIPLSAERFNGGNSSCTQHCSYSERKQNQQNQSNYLNSLSKEQQTSLQNSFSSQGIQISPFFTDSSVSKTKDKSIPISQLFLKNDNITHITNNLRHQKSKLSTKSNKQILAKLTKNSRDLSPFIRIENKSITGNYQQITCNPSDEGNEQQKQLEHQFQEEQQKQPEFTPNSTSYKSFCFYKTHHNKTQKEAVAQGQQASSSSLYQNKSSLSQRNLSLKDTSIKMQHFKNISAHLLEKNLWELIDQKGQQQQQLPQSNQQQKLLCTNDSRGSLEQQSDKQKLFCNRLT